MSVHTDHDAVEGDPRPLLAHHGARPGRGERSPSTRERHPVDVRPRAQVRILAV
ncbi:hypothetical protein AB0M10_09560 [Streptomyces sp. NPDC051840]|uniref:hypothetical protein n=1 Tax=unclassified Streptomyces TaxID=2593676 RepID=UPI003441D5FD